MSIRAMNTAPQTADAKIAQAKALLAGGRAPADMEMAARLLSEAEEGGSGEAAALIAVLVGADAGASEIWPHALGYLKRSAELGHEAARSQLKLLGKGPASSSDPMLWQQLRASIDVSAWLKPEPMRGIVSSPHVAVIENFISPEICDWLIERARPHLGPARVFNQAQGGGLLDKSRSNSVAEFNILLSDIVLLLVRARIAATTGFALRTLEETNVLHYQIGQQFIRHFDFLDPEMPGLAAEIAQKGQRAATFLVYLNDGYEGAETDFPLLDIRHRGRKGDALFFRNVEASGAPDRRTLHAGLAPTLGEKWLLSQWIRAKTGA